MRGSRKTDCRREKREMMLRERRKTVIKMRGGVKERGIKAVGDPARSQELSSDRMLKSAHLKQQKSHRREWIPPNAERGAGEKEEEAYGGWRERQRDRANNSAAR